MIKAIKRRLTTIFQRFACNESETKDIIFFVSFLGFGLIVSSIWHIYCLQHVSLRLRTCVVEKLAGFFKNVSVISKSHLIACEQALLFGRMKRVSLARSREAHFACPNRRACSQASHLTATTTYNNKFLQHYHFVQVIPIKITINS